MHGRPLVRSFLRLGAVTLLVLAAFLLRLWLEQWCPPNRFTVSIFYLVVVLASFFLGAFEAAVGAVMSGALAYWAFVTPTFAWKSDAVELISMASFGITSAVDIYFITAMKKAVRRYRMERQRFEMLAEGHAALFHDYSERTANYLNLLSITLKRGTESPDGLDMNLIEEASRQAFTLSSLHRGEAGDSRATASLLPFAVQLLENLGRSAGLHRATIRTGGNNTPVSSDRAAQMAILVAEWTHLALPGLEREAAVTFDLRFDTEEDMQRLSLIVGGTARPGRQDELVSPTPIATLIATHLGGRVHIVQTEGRYSFEFMAPTRPPAEEAPDPPRARLPVIAPHMTLN